MPPIRIAVVADIHHGRDTFTKKGTAALPLLDRFVDAANSADVDAVIDLGDRISDVDRERDIALQNDVAARFSRISAPRFHVNGNHYRAFLAAADNDDALGQTIGTRVAMVGPVRLVFWQPDVSISHERGFHLAEGDLSALATALGDATTPTVLVSHVPLSGHAQTGNYWFENNPAHATYAADVPAIRAVLAAAPAPILAIAGHVHWNTLTSVDGIRHLTLQSLTETFTTGDEPTGAMGLLTIDGDEASWRVTGADPFACIMPWGRRDRWRRPLDRLFQEAA